ncbi:MAG: lysophospholipase [Clostridia bacterium]|nr:lysophospholipase [Clostridia bacterium]
MAKYSTFESVTGKKLEYGHWPVQGKPRAVVQLVHGMVEHIRRYEATAEALNAAGFAVVGHSHLGHGKTAEIKGFFAEKNGWDALIDDVHALRLMMEREYPGVPYFLLGHSMGSFVVRGYCLKYEKGLAGVILSGTGHYDKPIVAAGSLIAKIQCALGGAKKPSELLKKISFAGYLKDIPNPKTGNDWLSRDDEAVEKYNADPLCGFTFTAAAYRDMFDGLSRLYPEKLDNMQSDIPVMFLSGDRDPVGANGTGVCKVAEELREAGVENVKVMLYPKGRHEMFNEINRDEAWADLIQWISSQI